MAETIFSLKVCVFTQAHKCGCGVCAVACECVLCECVRAYPQIAKGVNLNVNRDDAAFLHAVICPRTLASKN